MVFTPIHDSNTLKFIPFQAVTFGLIGLNVLVFLYQMTLDADGIYALSLAAGVTPAMLLQGAGGVAQLPLPAEFAHLPPEATLFTYMFVHADIWHLLGNMIFLWVLGDNVEDALGHVRFLIFYLLCGVGAAYAHAMIEPDSSIPLIGASGAIAGVVGAYLMLFPRAGVWSLILMRIPVKLPAYIVLGAWVAVQVYFIAAMDQSGTAWWAHAGGFITGAVLTPFFKRQSVPLFGSGS
ncbi:MAG: rhomboid family intramembrane serine protease [Alphaproteobacteria bacterium]|nr:rhomboid family intramembrane serine protease [Alphaproteobacteria bacterium]